MTGIGAKPQVDAAFYNFSDYVHRNRWASYWYQIDAVMRGSPSSVLEIGPGFGATTYALRKAGASVTTFDLDKELKPDLVGDVREIVRLTRGQSFDVVCAFQVLEHLPFSSFEDTLAQIARVSHGRVIISLPHWGYPVEIRLRLLKDIFQSSLSFKLTRPKRWRFDGQHHWELGTAGHSVRSVSAIISRYLVIERQYFCPDYSYHYFFECLSPQK